MSKRTRHNGKKNVPNKDDSDSGVSSESSDAFLTKAAVSVVVSKEDDSDSGVSSESSDAFQTEAAVSVVVPVAMQRPPTLKELASLKTPVGRFLVYLAVPGSNQAAIDLVPFVVIAQIRQVRRHGTKMYYDMLNLSCDQEQAHLMTITDGHWDLTKADEWRKIGFPDDKANWVDVGVNLVICVLPMITCRFLLVTGGMLPSGTSSLIVSLLSASTHVHAKSFVESGNRERRLRPLRPFHTKTFEELLKTEIYSDSPPIFPCGVRHCASMFRWKRHANLHMHTVHALSPDDASLYRFGRFLYPCRFKILGEDPCEFRNFKFFATANEHMRSSHGLQSDDTRLYSKVLHRRTTLEDQASRNQSKFKWKSMRQSREEMVSRECAMGHNPCPKRLSCGKQHKHSENKANAESLRLIKSDSEDRLLQDHQIYLAFHKTASASSISSTDNVTFSSAPSSASRSSWTNLTTSASSSSSTDSKIASASSTSDISSTRLICQPRPKLLKRGRDVRPGHATGKASDRSDITSGEETDDVEFPEGATMHARATLYHPLTIPFALPPSTYGDGPLPGQTVFFHTPNNTKKLADRSWMGMCCGEMTDVDVHGYKGQGCLIRWFDRHRTCRSYELRADTIWADGKEPQLLANMRVWGNFLRYNQETHSFELRDNRSDHFNFLTNCWSASNSSSTDTETASWASSSSTIRYFNSEAISSASICD
jgi:hypothetical protein